jgi:cobalt-zinc-cadmium efflux system membrane fusion protein
MTVKRRLLFCVAAILMGAAVSAAGPLPSEEHALVLDPSSPAGSRIQLATVGRKRIADRVDATATVEPDARAVAEITTRIPARVVRLIAEPGQLVKPGQPLAILSSVELGQAKTDYLKARSLEAIASQNLKREQELYAEKISPFKDVLQARAQYDTANAAYRAAREALSLLVPQLNLASLSWSSRSGELSEFPLASPIGGTLVRRNLTIGEAVDSKQPLMTVIDLDEVWVITNIFESDLAAVQTGDPVAVTVDAYPGRSFYGKVSYIGDEIDRQTRTVQARISVPNAEHLLKPGMFARAQIASYGGSREVLTVPESAVFSYQNGPIVFVATDMNRFVARPVRVGVRSGDAVEI